MLELDHLSRRYGDVIALQDLSLRVRRGQMYGFVGTNGAGKTTAMRIILGVLRADAGRIELDGHPLTAADLRQFGYMPEERGLYPKMEIVDQLAYLARLHGIDKAAAFRRADDLLERFGLAERRRDKLEALSLGNQQRVQVAAAMVHSPGVLVLDEPFSGLDPLAVDEVVSVIAEHAARGIPVLFSSHQLDVVERLCDDLVIIADGRIRAADSREGLRARYSGDQWSLIATTDTGWVRDVPGVVVDELAGDTVLFTAPEELAQHVLTQAVGRGPVRSFGPVQRSLGEIFRDVVVDVPRSENEAA